MPTRVEIKRKIAIPFPHIEKKRAQEEEKAKSNSDPFELRRPKKRKSRLLGRMGKENPNHAAHGNVPGPYDNIGYVSFGGTDEKKNDDVGANRSGNRRFSSGLSEQPEGDQYLDGRNEIAKAVDKAGQKRRFQGVGNWLNEVVLIDAYEPRMAFVDAAPKVDGDDNELVQTKNGGYPILVWF